MPVLEYSCMPIGEFYDLISIYQISSGTAREVVEQKYIPDLR